MLKYPPIISILLLGTLVSCISTQLSPPQMQGSATAPGASHPAPTQRHSWIDPEVRHTRERLLYVAVPSSNAVVIYKQRGHNQQPVGKLTTDITFPNAVWVDTQRNVWIVNNYSELESTILRFPQGSTTPDLTLPDPQWNASAVWVSDKGAVYVVNSGYYANFEIVEYPPHMKTAKVIGDRNLAYLTTAVVGDANGDLFASGFAQSAIGEIDERPAGSRHWRDTGIRLAEPGALAFDSSGNLVASDIGSDVIETFPPGQTTPSNTISCTAECASIAFNHAGTHLWVGEYNDPSGTVEERDYPKGTILDTLAQPYSYLYSVAASPDLYP